MFVTLQEDVDPILSSLQVLRMQAVNPSCSSEGMTVHDNMQLPFHSNGSLQSPAHFSTGRNLKKLNIYIVQRHPRHLLPEALPTWLRELRDRSHVFSASLCSRVAGCRVLRAPQYKMCDLACFILRGLPKQIWAMSGNHESVRGESVPE